MTKPNEMNPELIESRVVKSPFTGCWDWQMAKTIQGYGNLGIMQVNWKAHRASYAIFRGPIPDGLQVLHTCDNPSCCNPDHLWLGTNDDNVADKVAKGRQHSPKGEANPRAKITEDDVRAIRADSRYQAVIAAEYGISQTGVGRIKNNLTWRHVT